MSINGNGFEKELIYGRIIIMDKIRQAVILAGGLGKRMAPFTNTNPKPMYPFGKKPFIEYLVEQIKSFGIKDIIILLGYLPEKIMNCLGDGSKWQISIRYRVTPIEDDTQYRLLSAYDILDNEFLLMYCDNFCPVDYKKLERDFFSNQSSIQISAYRNGDGYTKSNLKIKEDGKVIAYDKERKLCGLNGVDIGYAVVSKAVFSLTSEKNDNFEAIVYSELVKQGKLYATVTEHRYYSIGSIEKVEATEKFLAPKKVVFLDRDGTLNLRPAKANYVNSPLEFHWIPGAIEAIKKLKQQGWLIILITNQPGIARGTLTEERLREIHDKMQKDLLQENACIDKIYYCPHNWDEGCDCRKPKPGMLYQAQKDFYLDLTKCVLIGDDERDICAGEAAGVKSILVNEQFTLYDAVNELMKEDR